jgi:hypothetical protein
VKKGPCSHGTRASCLPNPNYAPENALVRSILCAHVSFRLEKPLHDQIIDGMAIFSLLVTCIR